VGSLPITLYDLKQEVKLLSILNPGKLENQSIEDLQSLGIESLTIKKIKEQEIKKNKLDNTEDEEFIEYEISRVLKSLNMDKPALERVFAENQLEISDLKNHISIEIKWNRLVYGMYQNKIKIDEESVNKKVEEYSMKENSYDEYFLSEIIVPVSDSQNPNDVYQKVKSRLFSEKFENVAREISISQTRDAGGEVGWVNEKTIAEIVIKKIKDLNVGEITSPILIPEGIMIIKLNNKREIKNEINKDQLKRKIILNERDKMLTTYSKMYLNKLKSNTMIEINDK
jgi:peptidyl-prolyl cis-trans isomerase SurA